MGNGPALALRCLSAVGLLAALAACGYHLVGTATYLPSEYQTLWVKPFVNKSGWADMDQRLGEAVSREWVRRGRFRLTDRPEEAQLVLQGTVTSVMVLPVSVDARGRATEYQMNLTVAAELVDPRGDKPVVLWEDKAFSRRTSYQVDESAVDYFDRQMEAMEVLARDLAGALVTAVLEGF
jgi:outer membrane lipopolysaccharide assembly protein LptE/RlpB